MIKKLLFCLILYLISLLLIGCYVFSLRFIGHKFWPQNSSGSIIYDNENNIRGSLLLNQKTSASKYFKGRDATRIDNTCNVALYNDKLKKFLLEKYNESDKYDLAFITPSSSLLDPYITLREAFRQATSIALERNITLEHLISLIQKLSLKKSEPFFELEIVNTTRLNALLDRLPSSLNIQ